MIFINLLKLINYGRSRQNFNNPSIEWDFAVALNMIKSDNYLLLKEWFPDEKDLYGKIVELTINWLNDEDNPYGDSKVWGYFKK